MYLKLIIIQNIIVSTKKLKLIQINSPIKDTFFNFCSVHQDSLLILETRNWYVPTAGRCHVPSAYYRWVVELRIETFRFPPIILYYVILSDAVSGWAGWALAYLEFDNPIPTIQPWGEDCAHHITACPPGFENLTASLTYNTNYCISSYCFRPKIVSAAKIQYIRLKI